ncbi:hypothetical protein, partial [uncultured Campylobacter sp.]|uniref:hypothetical protein n=1 Tax=uncultured Campylobacter sp. TaxID=218934 RepID=UPI00262B3E21
DGSPNTAHGKTAESTIGKAASATARDTVVATVADGAENRAFGDEARAERSPDVARNMNAEAPDETKCKTVGATMSNAASGAMKEIASERAQATRCANTRSMCATTRRAKIGFLRTIFTGFWKNFKTKLRQNQERQNGAI